MTRRKLYLTTPSAFEIIFLGLSPLHQAIVNEDVEMVYFLCKKGADVHQRYFPSLSFSADGTRIPELLSREKARY